MKRAVAFASVVTCTLLAIASPASAHSGKALKASNNRTELVGLVPAVKGVTVRLIDADTRIELDCGTHRVVVLGYDGEPYLRVDREGVFENLRSPATYLNTSLTGSVPPTITNPAAAPVWRRVGDGPVVRWHDHALHVPPGQKLGARKISTWERPLKIDDATAVIRGRIVTLPARSRAPWLVLGAALTLLVLAGAHLRWRSVMIACFAVLVVADGARIVGLVAYTPTWLVPRWRVILDASTLSIIGWGMAIAGTVLLAKRRRFEAAAAAVVSGGVLAVAGGVLELRDLSAAVLGTSLPDVVARAVVAIVLGVGVGTSIAGALALRQGLSTPARPAPRSDSGPSPEGGTRTMSPSAPPSG
ncbi:MAG: hypothetical protein QOI47_2241 [Actinomycetota bacterium]|nr:hypothetical protein [Actinomycetota bacterium]